MIEAVAACNGDGAPRPDDRQRDRGGSDDRVRRVSGEPEGASHEKVGSVVDELNQADGQHVQGRREERHCRSAAIEGRHALRRRRWIEARQVRFFMKLKRSQWENGTCPQTYDGN
eukprot:5417529-Prymnesium_polylepis.4